MAKWPPHMLLNKLHLNLTGWEGLVLHYNSAAAGQDHDVEVLLFVVGLLVPLPHHIGVMRWNQSDLIAERKEDSKVTRIRRQKIQMLIVPGLLYYC